MPDSPAKVTLTLHPHQVAGLRGLAERYPLVERDQLVRLVLNAGLKALPNDEDAMMCLDAGNALAAERTN